MPELNLSGKLGAIQAKRLEKGIPGRKVMCKSWMQKKWREQGKRLHRPLHTLPPHSLPPACYVWMASLSRLSSYYHLLSEDFQKTYLNYCLLPLSLVVSFPITILLSS